MSLILFLLFGLVVGALARWMVPGREPGGWVASMVIGVLGSMFAGLVGGYAGLYRHGEPAGFVMSLLGAIVVTVAYHSVVSRHSRASA